VGGLLAGIVTVGGTLLSMGARMEQARNVVEMNTESLKAQHADLTAYQDDHAGVHAKLETKQDATIAEITAIKVQQAEHGTMLKMIYEEVRDKQP
jgi:hypothetical protein